MRSLPYPILACALLALAPAKALGSEMATGTLVVNARFSSRTSLTVSTEVLHFDVAGAERTAVAAVDFLAAARTQAGAEVVLIVEPGRALQGPGGAADVESSVTFLGEGDGTLGGVLAAAGQTIAGRWAGSGVRRGRLLFTLRSAAFGSYTVPVRFVLSAP